MLAIHSSTQSESQAQTMHCDECREDCSEVDTANNDQWQLNQSCRTCNDSAFAAEEKEFRSFSY